MKAGGFIQWTVENLVGSKWNAFAILGSRFNSVKFSLYGYATPDSSRYAVEMTDPKATKDRQKFVATSSMGMTSSRQYRLLFHRSFPPVSILLDSVHFAYCKVNGTHCPALNEYPSTFDGGKSIVPCPFGYIGHSFRVCNNSRLGEIDNSMCELQSPTAASYSKTHFLFVVGTTVTTEAPTVDSVDITWQMKDGNLPEGLSLNKNTGVVSGIPTVELNTTTFVILAGNEKGMVPVSLKLTVRKGRCNAEGFFPTTVVGETAVAKCSQQGHYMGTMHRKCFLGEKDGVWGMTEGRCFAIPMVVIGCVLGVLVVAGVVFVAVKIHNRRSTPVRVKKTLLLSGVGNRGKESRV